MSIRLDPRRLGTLKQLAAEAGVRPGDLVRQWVEERVDAARHGVGTPQAATDLAARLAELAERVAALEASAVSAEASSSPAPEAKARAEPEATTEAAPAPEPEAAPRVRAKRVSAKPATERVALHDEMIAVLAERGPMTAGELAAAVAERGRYQPPRSGRPLDAAMISQRVSNPTYRPRFTRNEGRIGLAGPAE
jgi:hypothetical protein